MTEQLKIKDLENLINKLKEKYPDNYKDIPIYLGNDDELNGIHTVHFTYGKKNNDGQGQEQKQELIPVDDDNLPF